MFEKDEPEVTDDLMHLIPHTTLLAPHCITLAQATFPALLRLLVTLLTATAPRINPTAPATRVLAGTLWPIAVRVPPGPAFTEVNAVLPLATVPTVLTVNPLRFLVTEAPAEAENRGIREDDKCGRDVETQKTMRKYSSERGQRLDESLVDGGRR